MCSTRTIRCRRFWRFARGLRQAGDCGATTTENTLAGDPGTITIPKTTFKADANLYDLDTKYADVVSVEDVVGALSEVVA